MSVCKLFSTNHSVSVFHNQLLLSVCRKTTLANVATAVGKLDFSLASSAAAFAQNPDADPQGFTPAFASALANNPAFAQKVAADASLSATVVSTLPGGGDITGLCNELKPSAGQAGSLASDTYACFCQRDTGTPPPLVSCVGKLAVMTGQSIKQAKAKAAQGGFQAASDALGRRLREVFSQQTGGFAGGFGSMRGASSWNGTTQPGRALLQQPDASSKKEVSTPCDGLEAKKTFDDAIEGIKKASTCSATLKLPGISQLCDYVNAGTKVYMEKQTFGKSVDTIGKTTANLMTLQSFLTNDAFGFDLDCCLGIELVDVCLAAGLSVPSYFVGAELGSYTMCNQVRYC